MRCSDIDISGIDKWNSLREKMVSLGVEECTFSEENMPTNPAKESCTLHYDELLSYDPNTELVYRDDKPNKSLQVRVYPSRGTFEAQIDEHNPDYKPFEHFIEDVAKKKLKEVEQNIQEDSEEILSHAQRALQLK